MATRRTSKAQTDALPQTDNLQNALSGLGVEGYDKSMSTTVQASVPLTITEIDELCEFNGFARKVVEAEAEEAMKGGFEVVAAQGNDASTSSSPFAEAMERLDLEAVVLDAAIASRRCGGGAVLIGADDGQNPDQPLNEGTLREIRFLLMAEAQELTVLEYDRDTTSANFGQPRIYQYSPTDAIGVAGGMRWHHSRVCRIEGARVSKVRRQSNGGWGNSVLQACKQQVVNFGTVEQALAHMVHEYETGVLAMKGLREAASSPTGRTRIAERAILMRTAKGIAKMMVIDADGEKYERSTAAVTGLADLFDRFAVSLSGASSIPLSRLFGTPPKGLSTDDKSGMRSWYDRLGAFRRRQLEPVILRICNLLRQTAEVEVPADAELAVVWPELESMTDLERSQQRLADHQADKILWEIGVLDEIEVRAAYAGAKYSSARRLMTRQQRARAAVDAPQAPTGAPPSGLMGA